jgi:hypothetical protein
VDPLNREVLDRVQGISTAKRKRLDAKAAVEAKRDLLTRVQLLWLLAMDQEEVEQYGVKPKTKEELPPPLFMEDMVKTPFGYARRCNAKSKRTHERCRGIAIRGKTKCYMHGGRSTGARTKAGQEKIAAAMRKGGGESRVEREKHRARMRWFQELERLCIKLEIMLPMPRPERRRKSAVSCS